MQQGEISDEAKVPEKLSLYHQERECRAKNEEVVEGGAQEV